MFLMYIWTFGFLIKTVRDFINGSNIPKTLPDKHPSSRHLHLRKPKLWRDQIIKLGPPSEWEHLKLPASGKQKVCL